MTEHDKKNLCSACVWIMVAVTCYMLFEKRGKGGFRLDFINAQISCLALMLGMVWLGFWGGVGFFRQFLKDRRGYQFKQ